MSQDTTIRPSLSSALSPTKRALLALQEMQTKLNTLEREKNEPIAIIGMGCRFPGGVDNPEAFWQLLREGRDAIIEVPKNRWDIEAYYGTDPDAPGKMSTRSGGFLSGPVDQFDPQFFGISPREAVSLDPQQRLLLEVSWEALEHANLVPEKIYGSSTGVFVGVTSLDYGLLLFGKTNIERIDAYSGTGGTLGVAAGRLSYLFGFTGPSFIVDTACSSSLVTTHLACHSLRLCECDLALVGGVNLMLRPEPYINFSKARMLSPDGRCKTFDAAADGYGRGEGCGVIVLKRLSDAQRDGNNILAQIRGSAVNQDGPSGGLTVPNGPAQEKVIRQALANAGIEPTQMGYIEAHGTGTSLGDPIEMAALGNVFCQARSVDNPLVVGSVKSNFGHLESAASVAGIIKVVLSLQHQKIPPHLHFKQPNPHIDWEAFPVTVPTELKPWSVGNKRRIAGVSSFSFSGTNAHLVIEEAPITENFSKETYAERPLHLLTLSAKTSEALKSLASQYEDYLINHSTMALADVCFTANTCRSNFNHRLSVVGASATEIGEKLTAFQEAEQESTGIFKGKVQGAEPPKVAFLFTGQGSQYVDMGRQLYETQPIFRQTLECCDDILRPYLDTPLLEVLYAKDAEDENNLLNYTAYTQPALFALEYALFELWQSWGIKPSVVMGHSVGEYVAACVAGVFSLEDGLKLIAKRAQLMQTLPQSGEMVSVSANEARINAVIQQSKNTKKVSIAALNGPESLVISGESPAIKTIVAILEADGIKTKPLKVSHAFHSPLMEPILSAFEQTAIKITFSSPRLSLVSNISGQLATDEIATPAYWCRHIRQPVSFATSMTTLYQQGCEIFLEIGPKPTLLGMGRQCLPDNTGIWLPSLRPTQSDWQQLLQSLGELYVNGVTVDWLNFDKNYQRHRVVLPTYPFQRQRYWIDRVENKAQQTVSLSPDFQTSIMSLLHQGKTEQLAQQLAATGELSEDEQQQLPNLLKLLANKHQQQIRTATLQEWFYEIVWQSQPRLSTASTNIHTTETNNWLIFADQSGIGQTLATLLKEQGQHVILAYAANTSEISETGVWNIDPTQTADFEGLLQVALEKPLTGIIHLWSLEATLPPEKVTIPFLEQAQQLGCGSVLQLVQILSKYNLSTSPKLWLVTRGVMPIEDYQTSLAVAQAPLWGLGKVIMQEYPELRGGMVDLALSSSDTELGSSSNAQINDATLLLAEILDSLEEDHIAFREGQRYVARVEHSHQPEFQTLPPLQYDGSYLITGGLGHLGLKVAQWMIAQGARYLILTGRSGTPSNQAQDTLSQMEQMGVQVQVMQANVSNEPDMVRVFAEINTSMPSLRGIIHAAGVNDHQAIKDIDLKTLESIFRPKVIGTWILHQLTQQMSLDFFVVFSSISSVWGSKGQGHYAAANHFMDVLVHHRQRLGLPALSVNWGPWLEGGMTRSEDLEWLNRMGIKGLAPELAIESLGYLLRTNTTQITVAQVDWQLFKGIYEARGRRPLLENLQDAVVGADYRESQPQHSNILQQLEDAPAHERFERLMTHVQTTVAQVLRLDKSNYPELEQGFADMGMDSLLAVELRSRLQNSLGHSLLTTIAFDYPTIQTLTEYLAKDVLKWEGIPDQVDTTEQSKDTEVVLSDIEQLSQSDVEASLTEELNKLKTLLNAN